MKYCIDVIFCVDSTLSMKPFIDGLKKRLMTFPGDLFSSMVEKGKKIDNLRVKVISFRNLFVDGDLALIESPFYILPDENEEFAAFVDSISALGGSNVSSSSGLEALALAIRAGWTDEGDQRRHIICLWTDKGSIPIEAYNKPLRYPSYMPANFDELLSWWQNKMLGESKRLLLFAPDIYAWNEISNIWNNTLHYVWQAGASLGDLDEISKTIIESISNSIRLQ